ncbi:uncharacterized protein LOC126831884 [Patella vulgata]|uniref:uncharacterized protein LOC126831884 n=1 Tax=Patella vulgata TaxID=6465 RepID=UPI00217F9883|nr:uncharacterized protein LOC126831884 [Patella vulgata]
MDREFSPQSQHYINFISGCPFGWAPFRTSCYKYFGEKKDLSSATSFCASLNSKLTTAKDKEEVDLIASIRATMLDIWVGLKRESDGWYWSDGTKAENLNWKAEPPAYKSIAILKGQDVDRKLDYPWYDYGKYPFVCQYVPGERAICIDRQDNCEDQIKLYPAVCTENVGFARQECAFSCNVCEPITGEICQIEAATAGVVQTGTATSLQAGQSVTYTCQEGFGLMSGDLGRGCLRSGQLTGEYPVCAVKSSLTTLSNNLNMVERVNGGNWRSGFTGMQEHFKIDRDGEITQWQFYSRTPGASELMVWRPSGSSPTTAMTLVGHNRVTTRRNRMQYIDIPVGQRIQVKAGDLIGLWVETGTGIPYDDCRGSYSIALNGWYNPNTFVTGNQYPFRSDYRCRIYSLKAKIAPTA